MLLLSAALMLSTAVVDVKNEPLKVLVMDLRGPSGKDDAMKLFNGAIANALANSDVAEVVTSEDIARIADLEVEKAAMDCSADSCLAEIASALGARHVVYGTVTHIEETWVLNVNYFDAEQARVMVRREVKNQSALAAAEELKVVVEEMLTGKRAEDEKEPTLEPAPAEPWPWMMITGGVVAALGAAGAITGGALLAQNEKVFVDKEVATSVRDQAKKDSELSTSVMVVGAVVMVAGLGVVGWQLAE